MIFVSNPKCDEIAQIDIHSRLQPRPIRARGVILGVLNRMYTAVAQDRKFLAQADFRDADIREKIWFLCPVQDASERGEDGVVVMGVRAELGNCLGDEHVEPV